MVDKLLTENYRKAGLVDPFAPPPPQDGIEQGITQLNSLRRRAVFCFRIQVR